MNVTIVLYSLMLITAFRKSLDFIDLMVAYAVILIPITTAVVNVFIPDCYHRLRQLEEATGQDNPPIACIGAAFGANSNINQLVKAAESIMYVKKKAFHERYPDLTR